MVRLGITPHDLAGLVLILVSVSPQCPNELRQSWSNLSEPDNVTRSLHRVAGLVVHRDQRMVERIGNPFALACTEDLPLGDDNGTSISTKSHGSKATRLNVLVNDRAVLGPRIPVE